MAKQLVGAAFSPAACGAACGAWRAADSSLCSPLLVSWATPISAALHVVVSAVTAWYGSGVSYVNRRCMHHTQSPPYCNLAHARAQNLSSIILFEVLAVLKSEGALQISFALVALPLQVFLVSQLHPMSLARSCLSHNAGDTHTHPSSAP